MDSHIPSMFLSALATICVSLLTFLPQSHSQQHINNHYTDCSRPFNCGGEVSDIRYPFWGDNRPDYCGGARDFKLHCEEDGQHASIQIGSRSFGVSFINIYPFYAMGMFRQDLITNICYPQFEENDLSPGLFRYSEPVHNITIFYACPNDAPLGDNNHKCPNDDLPIAFYEDVNNTTLYGEFPGLRGCRKSIEVPVSKSVRLDPDGGIVALYKALRKGFEVNYAVRFANECAACVKSGGACGTNDTATFQFTCHCPDGSDHASPCPAKQNHPWKWEAKLGIGATAAVFGVVLVSMAFYCCQRRKKTQYAIPRIQSQSMSFDPSSKDSEGGGHYFGVSIFTYSELEEATNYFDSSKELGEGGFGIVYFGILRDGRWVAVKRLYENNYKRVEQFKNEIKILTRIRHQNLVSLYGSTSRHSRELLLVYEYISNGTVADHLHGERAKASTLPWHIRMNIAVETASALAYLHACNIIHRDVKTKNILLDSYFVVKVADFGLSRIILNHVTDISTAPQGTPGYVDPEYYERYRLTDKSDVYSFGVVLIELISSLPAVDVTRHSHEINLSSMAINKIHNQALHELVDSNLGLESDYKVRKMISEVAEIAYQCLQSSSDKRPSMRQVMDTLKDIQSDDKCKRQPEVMDIST